MVGPWDKSEWELRRAARIRARVRAWPFAAGVSTWLAAAGLAHVALGAAFSGPDLAGPAGTVATLVVLAFAGVSSGYVVGALEGRPLGPLALLLGAVSAAIVVHALQWQPGLGAPAPAGRAALLAAISLVAPSAGAALGDRHRRVHAPVTAPACSLPPRAPY